MFKECSRRRGAGCYRFVSSDRLARLGIRGTPIIGAPCRFLHDQFEQAAPHLLRDMLTTVINTLLSADDTAGTGTSTARAETIDRQTSNMRQALSSDMMWG